MEPTDRSQNEHLILNLLKRYGRLFKRPFRIATNPGAVVTTGEWRNGQSSQ